MPKQLLNLLKIAVSAGLLIFVFSKIDLVHFVETVRQANLAWLTLALVMMFLGVVIRAWRWQILLVAIGVTVSIKELTSIYFIGFLFNNILPSGVGGDAVRIVEVNRHSERGSDALTSVLVERFLGLSALQAIGAMALLLDRHAVPTAVAIFTVIMLIAMLVGGYLFIHRPLYITLQNHLPPFRRLTEIKAIGNLFQSFQSYPGTALRQAYLVSLLFNLSLISMNVCIGRALGIEASVIQYAIFIPITSAILIIPISFGGLGLREGTYMQLFTSIGVSQAKGVAMSLLVYSIGNLATGLVGGVIYLVRAIRGRA